MCSMNIKDLRLCWECDGVGTGHVLAFVFVLDLIDGKFRVIFQILLF